LDNGDEQAIFISADMTEVPSHAFDAICKNLGVYEDLDFSKVTFHVTHSHNSTDFRTDFLRNDNEYMYGKDILPQIEIPEDIFEYKEAQTFFIEKMTELISKAWENRKPGGISYAQDYAAVGFNRRPVFEAGGKRQTIMYGDCSEPDFKRFEGGADHTADMLYTWDIDGRLTGVMVDIPCPSQVNELHYFISADFWAPTRNAIRERLGNVYVLPACGAAGDQNPLDLDRDGVAGGVARERPGRVVPAEHERRETDGAAPRRVSVPHQPHAPVDSAARAQRKSFQQSAPARLCLLRPQHDAEPGIVHRRLEGRALGRLQRGKRPRPEHCDVE
jgi:hypothetical protein